MDQFLEYWYQVLKRPSNHLKTFQQQKKNAENAKYTLLVFASWVKTTKKPTKIRRIKEKLLEGYYMKIILVWKLRMSKAILKKLALSHSRVAIVSHGSKT